mgnify:CR=1 FL=1
MAKKARSAEGGNLGVMNTRDIEAELRRRRRGVTALIQKRDSLRARLAEVEQQLRGAGGAEKTRIRPQNEMNPVEALKKVLTGKTMGVTQVADAVQKAGYKTFAANFRTIVNQTVIKNRKLFKKIARGQYTAS